MPSVFGARQADQQKQYVIHGTTLSLADNKLPYANTSRTDQNRRTVGQDTVYVQPIVPSAPPAEAISAMPEPRARRVANEQRYEATVTSYIHHTNTLYQCSVA